jgi:hypothetical protein
MEHIINYNYLQYQQKLLGRPGEPVILSLIQSKEGRKTGRPGLTSHADP